MKNCCCSWCGNVVERDLAYEIQKLKGESAGHWFLCSDSCLHSWLVHYNPLVELVLSEGK